MANSSITSVALYLLLVLSLSPPAKATVYVVGDALGWTFNILDPNYLTRWVAGKVFYVGDILVFNCAIGTTLVELTKEVYESGSTTPYIHRYNDGPSINTITLDKVGNRYFSSIKAFSFSYSVSLSVTITHTG